MTLDNNIHITDSVLTVKATGSVKDISQELELPDGKPIEDLLDDQEKESIQQDTDQSA